MRQLIFLLLTVSAAALECRGQGEKSQTNQDTFIDPEVMARFPGGYDSLMNFIKRNLTTSVLCSGERVFVEFHVNIDGSVSDAKIVKGLSNECDRRALEVVQGMPRWIPGSLNNVPIRHKLVLPIKFELSL